MNHLAKGQSMVTGSSFASLESIGRYIRFAVRSLLKAPGFAVIAILVIAVGIGANTAVFSVIRFCSSPSPIPTHDRWCI